MLYYQPQYVPFSSVIVYEIAYEIALKCAVLLAPLRSVQLSCVVQLRIGYYLLSSIIILNYIPLYSKFSCVQLRIFFLLSSSINSKVQ